MKTTWKIDPAHSSAHFSVRHMMITNIRGAFAGVKGAVVHDSENPANSSIEAVIDATTVNTMEAPRDAHLKSAQFLDTEKYPVITFKSSRIEPAGHGKFKVTGSLAIHGVTKDVVLEVEGPTAEGKDPWGNTRVGASGSTKIKRSDFGLTFNATLETGGVLVGEDVKIDLDLSLIKT